MAIIIVGGPAFADAPTGPIPPPDSVEGERRLKAGGGNAESETAVARGLAWLARQQEKDGSWRFDGSSRELVAATGMALLPFLEIGQSPDGDAPDARMVKVALDWLIGKMDKDGSFGTTNMYSHAIGTMALCDACRLTKNEKLRGAAERAVGYLLKAQARNGSWGYTRLSEGDTTIVGWQIDALSTARLAGFRVDGKVLEKADKFLDSVSTGDGAKYGYREKGASQTLTPVGLLSRHSIGKYQADGDVFNRGADFLKGFPPQKTAFDMYYYFYATRVMFARGGPDWHKFWNPRMRDMLIDLQAKDGEAKGSWEKDQGFIGQACGRIGTTALATLTLEVYYRYPPPKWMEKAEK